MDSVSIRLMITAGVAFLMAWVLVGCLSKKALQFGLVDIPNERSSHTHLKPRGGGIAIVLVWSMGCFGWWLWQREVFCSDTRVMVLFSCSLVIAGISLWDDYRSVGVAPRFASHLACAAIIMMSFGWIELIDIGRTLNFSWYGILITAIWLVGLTNAYNFMDGIDGIAGIQGFVAGFAWCAAGVHLDVWPVAVMGALIAAGCAGFLTHNWSPAKIFMGDVGSAFLGFVFGIFPLITLRELTNLVDIRPRVPLFALMVVWPFVADSSLTLLRRLWKHEPFWKPHRSHLYQRLVGAGWSHAAVASIYGVGAVLCSVAGLHYLRYGGVWIAVFAASFFIFCACFLVRHLEHNS